MSVQYKYNNQICKLSMCLYLRNRLETSDSIIIHGIYLFQFLLQSGIWVRWSDILSPYLLVYYCTVYNTVFLFFYCFLIVIYMIYA